MLNRVDHLVYACLDLKEGLEKVEALLGVEASPGGKHPDFGTHNKLFALGEDCFLEVIAPDPERTDPALPSIFSINKIDEPKLVTWAAKESSLDERLDLLKKKGIPFGEALPGHRRKPDGSLISWHLTDPYSVLADGLIPFLIDWGDTIHPAVHATKGCKLLDLTLIHPEPANCQGILDALDLSTTVKQGTAPGIVARISCPKGLVDLS